jgi:sulfatase modifying factor 1
VIATRTPWPLVGAVLFGACGGSSVGPPRAQVLLHVDTDGPVATAFGPPDPWTTPVPLFDRLRVDAYPPGASQPCAGCSNEFTVDADQFAASDVSFGVAVGAGERGWIARVRLTVQRFELVSGDPDPNTTIDTYLALPVANDGVVTDVSVILSTDSTGTSSGSLTAPTPAVAGPPGASVVGTWPNAQRTTCTTPRPQGAACVPGGAYWMGISSDHFVDGADPTWRRLVVLSPFWLDETEVTVGVARQRGLFDPDIWSGSNAGFQEIDWCTYTPDAPTPRDPLPVACISWIEASAYCKMFGGVLPSDAQVAYAAGGALGMPYPWGRDPPSCTEAIWGRDGYGYFDTETPSICRVSTNFMAPLGGPEPPGHGTRDVVQLSTTDRIVDLAGNVGEYLRDAYEGRDGPCWSPAGILRDPVCIEAKDPPDNVSVLEGGWSVGTGQLEGEARSLSPADSFDPGVGLRCAYPGR